MVNYYTGNAGTPFGANAEQTQETQELHLEQTPNKNIYHIYKI
jgi:hypothetical protein